MTTEKILYDIVSEGAEESFFRGISYVGKFVYASNKYIFAKIKYEVPKEYKGYTVLKEGQMIPIDKTFFNRLSYKVDDYVRAKERDTVDFTTLSELIGTVSKFNKRFPDNEIKYIDIKGSKFGICSLRKFLTIADELFLFQGGISHSMKADALVSRDSDNVIMVACCDREKTKNDDFVSYDTMEIHASIDFANVQKHIESGRNKVQKSINNESAAKSIKESERMISKLDNELEAYKKLTWVGK